MLQSVLSEFEAHSARLRERARTRRDAVRLKAAVLDTEDREEVNADDLLGKWQPSDEFQGDVNMRTLRALLEKIDDRGYERCKFFHYALHTRSLLTPLCVCCAKNFLFLENS
tara:strand:- start:11602 stop:11937 length:336 start_codon:yes stop_codon:yes gene_type:complete